MGYAKKAPMQWSRVELAQYLNQALGVTVITPWGLGQIPEQWIALVLEGESLRAQLRAQGKLKR